MADRNVMPWVSLLLLLVCSQLAVSRSPVKFLPGFDGPLPFELETGYVGVGDNEEVQLFYYFIKSQGGNPKKDPLLLWLTGGPGCSALSPLVNEIGPLNFKLVEYNGSLPTLVLTPHTWTKVASIIFVDSPVGTGFSYARDPSASQSSDLKQVDQLNQFFRKWLRDHPGFLSNPFYVGGDSYSGITVPLVAQRISNGNREGIKPLINLQGYILGNPLTSQSDINYRIPFSHGMGLISDELYESLKSNCGGEYETVDPSNPECLKDLEAYDKCTSGIYTGHILLPSCELSSPKPRERFGQRRYLSELSQESPAFELPPPRIGCPTYPYFLLGYWVIDDNVQKALHIRKGSFGKWKRCNHELPYTQNIKSSLPCHVNLSAAGYPSLIYSGDHDLTVPFLGTQAWIRSLDYSIVDDWRPWMLRGQIAGYTRTYSNKMTFATIKGGGHTAEYTPEECSVIFKRWIGGEPL